MLNSVSIIGRLGSDPVVKSNGNSVQARFEIAVNEFFKADNELQKKTHWVPCITFDRLAQIVSEFLVKGSQIGIRGPLKSYSITDSQGSKVNRLQVHVTELEFLSSRLHESNPSL